MANELLYQADTNELIDGIIRNASTGKVYVIATGLFEIWGASGHSRADYAIALTGDIGLLFKADMPSSVPVGDYFFVYTARQGQQAADDDPYRGQSQTKHWNGTELIEIPDEEGRHFCTLADVKTRLGQTATDFDDIINSIITGIDGAFENYVKRPLLMTDDDVIENFGADQSWRRLLMNRYPIISITSIKEADNYDFDNATALVENTDYRVVNQGLKGIILRIDTDWLAGEDIIEVKYRGGYCGADEAASEGEYVLPADLREAAIVQVCFMFKRKDDIGLSGISEQQSSITKFTDVDFLPMVKQTLDDPKYKRPSL